MKKAAYQSSSRLIIEKRLSFQDIITRTKTLLTLTKRIKNRVSGVKPEPTDPRRYFQVHVTNQTESIINTCNDTLTLAYNLHPDAYSHLESAINLYDYLLHNIGLSCKSNHTKAKFRALYKHWVTIIVPQFYQCLRPQLLLLKNTNNPNHKTAILADVVNKLQLFHGDFLTPDEVDMNINEIIDKIENCLDAYYCNEVDEEYHVNTLTRMHVALITRSHMRFNGNGTQAVSPAEADFHRTFH